MGSKSKMKCHYEVLGLGRDCGDDEIKKSYRKMALKYHPDKNPDNIEECTRIFHLVQQAYDVLIDPQERAWYDKHREAILKGGLGHGEKYEDNSLDVYQYFNTSCFSGYGDDEEGFYAVFREVFKTIAAEDAEFKDDEEEENNPEEPEFGDSTSSYDDVVHPFYAYWESYCTAKSYVWVEKYDTREAPNRMVRRLMEQDNKKLRDKARKERNEEVRALVGFVRKRDKRVQAHKILLEERAAEGKRRMEERQRKQREERLKEMQNYKETSWSAASELEKDLEALEANLADQFNDPNLYVDSEGEDSEEEDYIDDLFCVACGKSFRTEKAFANHEKSKKHKENVAFLKSEMLSEEKEVGEVLHESIDLDQADITDEEEEPPPKQKLSKKQKKKRKEEKKLQKQDDDDQEGENEGEDLQDIEHLGGKQRVDEEPIQKQKLTKKQKKRRKQQQALEQEEEEESLLSEKLENCQIDSKSENCEEASAAENPTDAEAMTAQPEADDDKSDGEDESAVADGVNDATCDMNGAKASEDGVPHTPESLETADSGELPQESADHPSRPKNTSQLCHTCKKKFPSRNKLFGHIKATGHALRIEVPQPVAEEPKAKKGKKKGKR